jgi:CNT family concentrative nucleoside transporter
MLLAFIALIALLNYGVGAVGGLVGVEGLSLERIFGWALAPLAWLMGVPWQDAGTVGSLVGVKAVVNEFVAYLQLAGIVGAGGAGLEPRSAVIATYALLGFANFSSIAIQIGGIGGLAPERRGDLARLGLKAMIGGNLAAFMSASLAGMLV